MAEPTPPKDSKLVLIDVPSGRWWKVPFKWLTFLVLVGVTAAPAAYFFVTWKYSDGLPDIPKVEEYRPPILSEVYTQDAVLAGEFYNERRKVVPYERIPKRLVQAFIAAEDNDFFDHFGIDVLGTGRAVFKTLTKKVTGKGKVQGGSTLTQQTAKAVLISAEGYKESTAKTIKRKIREALLARRLETELKKEEILYLYLNNVYLGHHSYGVQSAAENYFRKDVKDLTLAEMTLLAGLPQAPSTLLALHQRRGRQEAPHLRAGPDDAEEHDHPGRARRGHEAGGARVPGGRRLPRVRPLLHRGSAPRHRQPLRQRRAPQPGPQGLHHHGLREAARRAGGRAVGPLAGRQAPGLPRRARPPGQR